MVFKKGSNYSRKDIGWILLPEAGRPTGGDWDTGYVRVGEKLIIFMNIGVPGKTNHDFDNYYDEENKTIVWYGKPNSHSGQPTFQKLFNGELTPYFFARWDNNNPDFTFLGVGKILSHKDGVPTQTGKGKPAETIELKLAIEDSEHIMPIVQASSSGSNLNPEVSNIKSSFALEKHLESFIVANWSHTDLSKEYDLYEHEGGLGRQFRTRSGPLDILAISKDRQEFLVIELKKGRASDEVVGQIMRYMGYIKNEIANNRERVKGMIIALEDDRNLQDALSVSPDIGFMRYRVNFELVRSDK